MSVLWLVFAFITAAVLVALLRPLSQGAENVDAADPADVLVYKDQLTEIDADAARGLIQAADADVARREIARRLLTVQPEAPGLHGKQGLRSSPRLVAQGLVLILPLTALGSYWFLGSPNLPSVPFAAQQAPLDQTPVNDLVAKVEARLAQNPNDGQGWDVIAPVYFRQQRHAEAADAFARAAALLGESPQRLAGFAEATVLANSGIVTEPARLAYEKLVKADPTRIEPRFWLALAKEQDGQTAAAAADYRALLAGAPSNASWRPLVEERLAAVSGQPTPPRTTLPPRGPSADDVAAAGKMSDTDRGQMIRGMVDGLAKRLADNPNDVQGWVRLVQSYSVLGERARAVDSLAEARRKLAADPQALAELATLAKSLGLGS
jgi:cytochrome c-type biogenesis protein CcmH